MQQRYVVDCCVGYSCLGFATARDHANQIAHKLGRPDLAFAEDDYATIAGYEKYCNAVEAWSRSPLTRTTYFDPGTDAKAAKILECCRTHERKVRLIIGDTRTGEPWLEEHDVVGRISRSTAYREADLSIQPSGNADRPWDVLRRSEVVASFGDIGQASAYLAFMRGATIEPRLFQ